MPNDTTTNSRHEAIQAVAQSYEDNGARLRELADLCERESRGLTDSERSERDTIMREMELQRMRLAAYVSENAHVPPTTRINREQLLRDNMAARVPTTFVLTREVQTSAALEGTGLIPVSEQAMLKPLREELIYHKLGLTVCHGLAGGKLRWPRHTKATGQFAEEGEKLVDSKIDWDKLEVRPVRLGCAIPVTREEIESTAGLVEDVINEEIPLAAATLINDALLSLESTYETTDGKTKDKKVVGPFAKATRIQFAGAVPTRAELLRMKSKVAGSGIKFIAPCYIMTENMKAELENTPVDKGSGRFLCEDNRVLGFPVLTYSAIGEGNIGFGDWSYQASGFFGDATVVVDPYTLARQNATDFVYNDHFATATLYQEAFVLGVAKSE